jgi:hypothetical protein
MTASTFKGTMITNLEAAPALQADRGATGNGLKVAFVTQEIATTSIDEQDDIALLLPLPSGARMLSLVLMNDDLDAHATPTLAVNVGGYYGADVTGQTAGTAIDVDNIATAITTLQAANTTGVEILFEALDINKVGKPLWEILGLTANPGGTIYIGFKVTTAAATAAAGTVNLRALYV